MTTSVETQFFSYGSADDPVQLKQGGTLPGVTLAYETHGTLSPAADNAVLVFHALTGSHHASGLMQTVPGVEALWTDECVQGWWTDWIGPGLALDTDRYFVICVNYIGSCYGSTGPTSINPATGKPWGGDFPIVTTSDIVDSQIKLLDHLGIDECLAVIGGSVGGMLVLDFATRHPNRTRACIPIATGTRVTALTRVLNFEQVFAIEEDPNFNRGHYYDGEPPTKGLTLARMISHKTFISLKVMEQRARSETRQDADDLAGYKINHPLESYMLHQGKKFVQRFDANAYLRIMSVWQEFDLYDRAPDRDLTKLLAPCADQTWLVFSIDSDVCYYPEEQAELVAALKTTGIAHQHVTIHSDKGHDSFLLEPDIFRPHMEFLLKGLHRTPHFDKRQSVPSDKEMWYI
jgi:homoserine O-acetyltransferase